MITLNAKIDLIYGNKIESATSATSGNNISSNIPLEKTTVNSNPFILSSSRLGENASFSEKVNYFIGNNLSDKFGIFQVPYEITLRCSPQTNSFTIAFDTRNNRHPKSILVDGKEYFDDDSIFTIVGLSSDAEHKIVITNWNAKESPVVISGIYVNISIDIDRRNLISFNRKIFDRSDIKFPSYGIISNTGNIIFKDKDGEIADYAEQGILTSDLNVKVNLLNTLNKNAIEQIGEFETKEWNYDNDNRSVSVSLKDDLEEWQDIYRRIPLSYSMDALTFYSSLKLLTPKKWIFEELDTYTYNFLSKYIIDQPYLERASLWSQWNKFCEVCGLHIYKNSKNKVVVIRAFKE